MEDSPSLLGRRRSWSLTSFLVFFATLMAFLATLVAFLAALVTVRVCVNFSRLLTGFRYAFVAPGVLRLDCSNQSEKRAERGCGQFPSLSFHTVLSRALYGIRRSEARMLRNS